MHETDILYKPFIFFKEPIVIANTSLDKTPQKKDAATAAARTSQTAKPAPTRKVAAKPAVRRPAKPASKPVAGVTGKPAKDKMVTKEVKADKNAKPKKAKLVRDSFTMPASEYELIADVKRRCIANGLAVKKSEVLRAAVIAFSALSDSAVATALKVLPVIKTGRPAKGQK
jgi:hypothetical protein